MDKNERKRLSLALAVLFAVNILLTLVMTSMPGARAETCRQGSTGDTVRQIQTKLKNWGYYDGVVDGIYGPKTSKAVTEFQKRSGLTADGMCGMRTQQAMGINMPASNAYAIRRDGALDLLSRLIAAEAKDAPYAAQTALGALVLNRVKHPLFPDSIADVIYQPGAFDSVTAGGIDKPPGMSQTALRAARDALCGADPGRGAVYFRAGGKTEGYERERVQTAAFGGVRFYK